MPIVVQVVSAEDYTKWVASRKQAMAALPTIRQGVDAGRADGARREGVRGECQACHQATGMGVPPAFPPLAGSKVVARHAASRCRSC